MKVSSELRCFTGVTSTHQQRNCQAGIYISATFPSTLMLLYLGPCTPA